MSILNSKRGFNYRKHWRGLVIDIENMAPGQAPNDYEIAAPPADAMVEALRGVGYSTATALADLVDNSITALARNVWIHFCWEGSQSCISLLDDGQGMSESELFEAMRPGSANPLAGRSPSDLGRFGLGLKTASFSRCRRLTVCSRPPLGDMAVRRWDLDHIARVQDWQLLKEPAAGSHPCLDPINELAHGTLVLWEELDRVVQRDSKPSNKKAHDAFLEVAEQVQNHLAMVFHRFLDGICPDLRIYMNGTGERHRIKPWDPFLTTHSATTPTPEEKIGGPGSHVRVKGYVLPHKDQLNEQEYQDASGQDGWTSQQGFYVYRNRRMLVAGDWIGLGRPRLWTKEEQYKLARLRLDICNEDDPSWSIDIKKSRAKPPRALRDRLIDIAKKVRNDARRVFVYRGTYGKRAPAVDLQRAWISIETSSGTKYRIDRNHPAIMNVLESPGDLHSDIESMLRVIEESVPVQRIWLETVESEGALETGFKGDPPEEVTEIARTLLKSFMLNGGLSLELAREHVLKTEPFNNYPDLVQSLTLDDEQNGR